MHRVNTPFAWSEEQKKDFVMTAWRYLAALERFIFNKLFGAGG